MPPGLLRRWARGEILDAKEWKECCEPEGMMLFLSRFDALAHRRERGTMLFACHAVKAALCHVHQDLLTEELQMFEEAECWHDVVTAVICGHFTVEREACEESEGESDDELLFDEPDRDCGCHDALEMATHAHYIERPEPGFYWGDDLFDRMAQKIGRDGVADLIRDLYGNPFAPVTVDPAWVNDTVLGLARDIYDEDAFRRMPLLASALVMAGCDHPEILAHCRQPGEHFRGCWLIDAILGN